MAKVVETQANLERQLELIETHQDEVFNHLEFFFMFLWQIHLLFLNVFPSILLSFLLMSQIFTAWSYVLLVVL